MTQVVIDDQSPAIVVIDDDEHHLDYVTSLLNRSGFQAEGHRSWRSAYTRLQQGGVSHVVTDLLMPEADGIEAAAHLRRHFPEIGIIGITGCNPSLRHSIGRLLSIMGVQHLLPKPLEPAALLWALAQDRRAPDTRTSDSRANGA